MNKIFKIIYLTATLLLMVILQPLVLLVFVADSWQKKSITGNNQSSKKIDKVELTPYKISQELQVWT